MRQAYAHDAVLLLEDGGDERAPGGAITLALCGNQSHEPPCPLAPHHTRVHRVGRELTLRLLFAAEPADLARVRALVDVLTDVPALQGYHLLPSVRGDLLEQLGRRDEARAEFTRAAQLSGNDRERAIFTVRCAALADP